MPCIHYSICHTHEQLRHRSCADEASDFVLGSLQQAKFSVVVYTVKSQCASPPSGSQSTNRGCLQAEVGNVKWYLGPLGLCTFYCSICVIKCSEIAETW